MTWARLGRKTSHRVAMLRNMVTALIKHERIETTLPKAKAVRRMAERMVTLGKRGDGPARRLAYAYVRELPALKKLFDTLGPRYKLREGGYTRVIRSRYRRGDKALMAYIEFVDRPGELRPARPPRSVRLHMESKAKAQQGDGQVQIPPIESAP